MMRKVMDMQKAAWRRCTQSFSAYAMLIGVGVVVLLACTLAGPVAIAADGSPISVASPTQDWNSSGHADKTAEAFTHWNSTVPPEIPVSCAKCHSKPGYLDFLGADGSEAGAVNAPAKTGTTIDCLTCHNARNNTLSSVTFPSGVDVNDLGPESRCMVCHQGRESKVSVDNAIAKVNLADPNELDTADPNLGFVNIHYAAAAATQYGGATMGGYQYDGKSYDIKFAHVEGMDTCIDCHDQHSLAIRIEKCAECHEGVLTDEDLKTIRMAGSWPDYDGDGDFLEGISGEIQTLHEALYEAIQAYAADANAPIAYNPQTHPYFFNDTNGDGQADPNESVSANKYASWTPRLLKAAYNYQVVLKDPGAYAHNAKYVIQLMFDSIEDLTPDRAATLTRNDISHFAGSEEPWRHWDEDGEVSASCSKCHSAAGLPLLAQDGTPAAQPLSNGLACGTCHDSMPAFTRYQIAKVKFPSGAELDTGSRNSNLCITCHQGRESTVSVANAIAGLDLDTVSSSLRFINSHYFAAGATLFGTLAKGMYEYEGKTYKGRFKHIRSYDTCTECHNAHALDVRTQSCMSAYCHGASGIPQNIRRTQIDFDGDGSRLEGLAGEIDTLAQALLEAMAAYAKDVVGTPIAYDGHAHPYFYSDDNGNGVVDAGEARYGSWTPRLLRAAYNYQYVQKEPGAFAHNGKYVIQVLYDALEDLSAKVPVDMSRMIRP